MGKTVKRHAHLERKTVTLLESVWLFCGAACPSFLIAHLQFNSSIKGESYAEQPYSLQASFLKNLLSSHQCTYHLFVCGSLLQFSTILFWYQASASIKKLLDRERWILIRQPSIIWYAKGHLLQCCAVERISVHLTTLNELAALWSVLIFKHREKIVSPPCLPYRCYRSWLEKIQKYHFNIRRARSPIDITAGFLGIDVFSLKQDALNVLQLPQEGESVCWGFRAEWFQFFLKTKGWALTFACTWNMRVYLL